MIPGPGEEGQRTLLLLLMMGPAGLEPLCGMESLLLRTVRPFFLVNDSSRVIVKSGI